ncbi:type IVB secretion system protein IcmF [Legionella sp. CNM-4043-24]|uniref:type IVB secretion system protein IcmF n=1 Tax=Legionella sp. CNM-4043-24 TaxID=3421646 RepID=UPI00403AEDEE
MDITLQTLCDALTKVMTLLKPQSNPLSFVLLTGKINQGKTALLRQSGLQSWPMDTVNGAHIFYNDHGIILELGEDWLNQSDSLLAYTCKHLNRCHKNVKISGLILCVDSRELLQVEPAELDEYSQAHGQLLQRFGEALGYYVDLALIFTKLDSLAGFCEFFQSEHSSNLAEPLGFSLHCSKPREKLLASFRLQYDHMIELLGQKIIARLHPARSGAKRTLIREFPLQLASFSIPVQTILLKVPSNYFRIQAVYFTSSEQGGQSIDRLNQKIQHEYALTVQDKIPQSNNYRTYFIEGALRSFQLQTQRHTPRINKSQKWYIGLTASAAALLLSLVGYQYVTASRLLDETSKELLTYETLISQTNDKTAALYHLSLAEARLGAIPSGLLSSSLLKQLKVQLHENTDKTIKQQYVPDLLATIEGVLSNPGTSQPERYKALKVYLMLSDTQHFSEAEVLNWFTEYWKKNNQGQLNSRQRLLLATVLKQPVQALPVNQQAISDARNYMNALPAPYLYYSLVKEQLPQQRIPISVDGFDLTTRELPGYFTKAGFNQVVAQLPDISSRLLKENWVLQRQDLDNLYDKLLEAYCFEYITWWKNFIERTRPQHFQGYQQARLLTQVLYQKKSIATLIDLIQQETSPDMSDESELFNHKIASQFTTLSLMSHSSTMELARNVNELEKYLTTLSLVNDDGRTVFELTRARFQSDTQSDPLSSLYNKSHQLPEPVATWAKQIADDTWFIFINESKSYLNAQWKKHVYSSYETQIANRFPMDATQKNDIALEDFDRFFQPNGTLNSFVTQYLQPFIDTSNPQWQPKDRNGYVLPISAELINELIRANVISNMFFPEKSASSRIEFSLQKISLDPIVASFQLSLGNTALTDNQESESFTYFKWPESNARLRLDSIEGNHFELEESGTWAFFRMLQKVNVLVDSNDSSSLEILFEVNGNSGRYILKTQNQINPFSPGILTGFNLPPSVA